MKYATPKATVLAYTKLNDELLEKLEDESRIIHGGIEMDIDSDTKDCDSLIEITGRDCYQSHHKPNPKTAANPDYIKNIIKQKHGSVMEHSSITIRFTGLSRATTHEIVRHRHFSFSQLSQRFVNSSTPDLVLHPTLKENNIEFSEEYLNTMVNEYRNIAEKLESTGLPRKQVFEAARQVLPNATETKINVTGNIRAWREFIEKRLSPAADKEINLIARLALAELIEIAPSSFDDMKHLLSE